MMPEGWKEALEMAERYRNYFSERDADIALGRSGTHFFYVYDKEHGYFEVFHTFRTAAELEELILGTLAEDLECMNAVMAENLHEPKPEKKRPAVRHGWRARQKEWKRMAGQMEKLGILTEIDMAAFAGYCQAYARWKEAEEFITQHGTIVKTPSGYWQQVPQVSIAQTYLKIMNRFCEQFGLTPSSRSRIVAEGGEDKESDTMELLLFKGGGG